VLIAAIVLLVPIAEELIYRVFFQSMFLRIVRSRWAAVFVTSFRVRDRPLDGAPGGRQARADGALRAIGRARGVLRAHGPARGADRDARLLQRVQHLPGVRDRRRSRIDDQRPAVRDPGGPANDVVIGL
jgi:hypothetical protein